MENAKIYLTFGGYCIFLKKSGEATQVHHLPQIVPDSWRFEIAQARARRQLAFPLSRLSQGIQQADQSEKSSIPSHR